MNYSFFLSEVMMMMMNEISRFSIVYFDAFDVP